MIRGGDWASSTPAWCEVDCRIGLMPGSTLEDARAGVERCIADAARGDGFMANNAPDIIWNGFQANGYVLEPGSDAERVLADAHRGVFGAEMEERRSTAVNDTRFYGLYHRMPALCYGRAASTITASTKPPTCPPCSGSRSRSPASWPIGAASENVT